MPYERHANHANHHDGTGASYNNVDGGYHQHSSQHNHHHHHSHHQEHRDRERTLSAGGFRSLPPLSFALQVPHRSPSWPMAPPASSYPYPPPSSLDCIPPKLEPELQEYQSPPLSPIRDLNELVKRPFITNDKTDADQLRRHKAYSKRDAGKLLKEAEYERDPSLVEVVPEERCRRCSSQYWRCFVERNPDSPRRVCRPCGKNKCSFGNSPNRPTTVDDAMPSPMQYQPSHTPIDHTAPHMPIPIAPASQWRSFGASVEPGTSSSNIGPIRPRPRALSLTPRQFPGTMYPDTPRAWREHDLSSPADSPPMLDDSGDRDLADHSGWATPCTELASPRTDGGAHEPMVALTTAVKKLSPTTATAPTSPTSPTAATPKLASAAPSGRYLELLGVVLKIESLSSEDDRQKLMAKMAAAGELDPEAQARWIKDVTEWSRSREVRARQKANEKRATAESIKAIEARTRALEERTSVLEARAGPGAEGRGSATDATDDSHGHGRGRWGLSPAPAGV
ncbi:hypothetical protein Q8F55_001877 [Vanrija albida]|uniref:GATA-type domain-containing protein n=1 Tax=Vanrija albida TaxID=181172 RepID=A0ABR3Q884_9TREE